MTVTFGRTRSVIPNQNLGQNIEAQRRLAEVAGRAAEKTRVSVSVDAWPARLFLRNPRGTIACACCAYQGANNANPANPGGNATVVLDGGEFDDIGAVDSGYPRGNERNNVPGQELRAQTPADDEDVGLSIQRLLIGNGRRCGICWGTGWIDGHRMWGGNRRVMCILDTPGVELINGDVQVDADSPTPTMVGPGVVTWSVRVNFHDQWLDALRARDQLLPAPGGYTLEASIDGGTTWLRPNQAMTPAVHVPRMDGSMPIVTGTFQFRLTLQDAARVSHVELVSRSERLVNLQLPQLSQASSAELIGPFLTEEFEVDPIVGYVERGSLLDVDPRDGRLGQLWMVTDVTNKRTSAGQIFGVVGTVRSAQPTDIIACASMTDALASGLMDYGRSTRGLEPTGGGVPSGLGDETDESTKAARRGSPQRLGGGDSENRSVIVLSDGEF